mgnify:CR=1 FL=1
MTARIDNTHVSGGSGATAPVRVIAVDDHPLTRRGVAEELGEDARLEVLGTFPSFGAVPLPLRTPSQVKVAVIDLAVRHETRGVESVALVSSWGIPSVVYTMHGSAIIRDEALRAGALGFVSKSAAGGELVTAVLEAAAGRTYEAGVEYLPGGEELTDLERRVLHAARWTTSSARSSPSSTSRARSARRWPRGRSSTASVPASPSGVERRLPRVHRSIGRRPHGGDRCLVDGAAVG